MQKSEFNSPLNESQVSAGSEAELLKSKSLPGTAAKQAACPPHEFCSLCCGEAAHNIAGHLQENWGCWAHGSQPEPSSKPSEARLVLSGMSPQDQRFLQPLTAQAWAPLFAGQCQCGWAGDSPAATPKESGCSAAHWAHHPFSSPNKDPHVQNLTLKRNIPSQLLGISGCPRWAGEKALQEGNAQSRTGKE